MDDELDPAEGPLSFMAVLDRTAKHPSTSFSIYSDSPSRHVQFPLNTVCLSSFYTAIQQDISRGVPGLRTQSPGAPQ